MKRVLYIEDDLTACETAVKYFRSQALNLECAHSMAVGEDRLSQKVYDCLLLDPGLPDSEGVDTIQRAAACDIPTVVLTGSKDHEFLRAARRRGMHFVLKAAGAERILEEVRLAMEHREPSEEGEEFIFERQSAPAKAEQKAWWEKWSGISTIAGLLLTVALLLGGSLYEHLTRSLVDSATIANSAEKLAQHDKTLDEINLRLEEGKNDRTKIHGDLNNLSETQKQMREDTIRRLERIEDKIDRHL